MALTGLAAGTIALLVSARPVQAPPKGRKPVLSVRFRPDGRQLVTHTGRGPVRVLSVCFTPDGRQVRAYPGDGTVRVWDARTDELLSLALRRSVKEVWHPLEGSHVR